MIPVDAKKKDNMIGFKNSGRSWRPTSTPEQAVVRGLMDKEPGKASPYGVSGGANNIGWAGVGISRGTGVFAVESISRWRLKFGKDLYLAAADFICSNGAWAGLRKIELQELSKELEIEVFVCRLPPGTGRRNTESNVSCSPSSAGTVGAGPCERWRRS